MSSIAVLAGSASTVIFAAATLPMLRKAATTRDLGSYSLGNIGLANLGNAVHSVYVLHLPPGPIWVLHGFYVVTSATMLVWYLRYALLPGPPGPPPAGERPGLSRSDRAAPGSVPAVGGPPVAAAGGCRGHRRHGRPRVGGGWSTGSSAGTVREPPPPRRSPSRWCTGGGRWTAAVNDR